MMKYFIKPGWQFNPNEREIVVITKKMVLCGGE